MKNSVDREPTVREVLLECRGEISQLRHENNQLKQQNKMLLREKEMLLTLFERSRGEGDFGMSPDPLFSRIQRQIELLHED